MNNIRNFVIIAHVDHGKSTLADRMLEITGTIPKRLMRPQFLDSLELERERGITIKMTPVRMSYTLNGHSDPLVGGEESHEILRRVPQDDGKYILNLIDTPGHADFSYEVSRALAAVEGAVLLVDATQGMQAQTLSVYESAQKVGLKIIGVVNKVDIAAPDQREAAINELAEFLSVDPSEILKVSGKTGEGVSLLLEKIIEKVPSPKAADQRRLTTQINADTIREDQRLDLRESAMPSRALIFDSVYDDHKGIIAFIRVFNGTFTSGIETKLLATNTSFKSKEIGYFAPKMAAGTAIQEGEIGYLATGIKDADKIRIGDTVVANGLWPMANSEQLALPGYKEPKPVVFVSFYPEEADDYEEFKKALSKLRLTDSALKFEADSSEVLGRGFKGGFLGRLHFEIAAERLDREFGIKTTHSFPSVAYKVRSKNQEVRSKNENAIEEWQTITNPKDFSDEYDEVQEPITRIEILTPMKFLNPVLRLKDIFRFSDIETKQLGSKIMITAKLPLADLIRDLDDKLKSVSEGFASLTYEVVGWEKAEVSKLEILVAEHIVPGLTRILPKKDVEREARTTVERLKELLPQEQFTQAIQASVRGKIIARETVPAMRKDVANFGKNGGDRTRKMKLWKKQQRGKVRLKERAEGSASNVRVPASVFKELLKK